ncbi:MAG: hypothetical protein J6C49_04385 [Elusimicrobiaceae bacterium]|nr:hypothetical protein [Elusimicrobiaceae bacterium]
MKLRYTGQKPQQEMFQAFNETMRFLFEQDQRVVYLDADLMGSLKTHDLWKAYPKNVFNTGIQEANMIGVACGLNLNGFKPYVHSFSPFASRRVFDQLFLSAAYAGKSLRVIGSDAGIMATHNGGTHMCFEDVAIMRTIPNACVIDVTDAVMLKHFLVSVKDRPGVTYLRIARRDVPDVYPEGTSFEEGKGIILQEGTDVTLLSCGIMVATCLQAAALLQAQGVSAQVVDIVTVKPLDKELLLACARKTGAVLVAENANILGGLGAAAAECLCEEYPIPVTRVGIQDQFGQVGPEAFLREKYGLTAHHIAKRALDLIQKKNLLKGKNIHEQR